MMMNPLRNTADLFGIDNQHEAFVLLDLINAEFQSDPTSVQCFDLRVVDRVKQCIERRKQLERRGEVPPILTPGKGARA